MAKVYSKCNYCGVPESQWVNGKCIACGRGIYCDMREEDIIEQRVYDWFVRRGVVNNGAMLYRSEAVRYVNNMIAAKATVPKYIHRFIADVAKKEKGERHAEQK